MLAPANSLSLTIGATDAKGKAQVQAQSDEMALTSLKDLTITSVQGRPVLSAGKEVWIGADGSHIKIGPNLIENGTAGRFLEKCASWDKPTAASSKIKGVLPNATPTTLKPGHSLDFSERSHCMSVDLHAVEP